MNLKLKMYDGRSDANVFALVAVTSVMDRYPCASRAAH